VEVLGVHGEVRCRARMSLVLDLAKWQDLRGSCNCNDQVIRGLFA